MCVCLRRGVRGPRRGEATRSWKDKGRAKSAASGGAPDLFEWSSDLIRSRRVFYLFSLLKSHRHI